ncbi:HAD hydrolase family protein [Puniceicoccaceae bacterium K14]|nr:HAD hydrolase family protein [Puniceicoccaceae bacterium K14]
MSASDSSKLDWSAIKVFAMDVDGILTDGCIYVSSDGSETKRFSIIDGLGLVRLRDAGIQLAWISGRGSYATNLRANELKIPHVIQGRKDKETALTELLEKLDLKPEQAAYMGDDDIDTAAIKLAGIGISVPEGQDSPKEAADYITERSGGNGAVREICNHILKALPQ